MDVRSKTGHVGELAIGLDIPLRIAYSFPAPINDNLLIARALEAGRNQAQGIGANRRIVDV